MLKRVLPLLILPLAAANAQAADPANGESLHDGNCFKCHGTEIYTRKDHRVTSRPGLTKQVNRCQLALGLSWFDDEIEDTAEYLNAQFYHLKK